MDNASAIVRELVASRRWNIESLAVELNVSASSVNRWMSSKSRPRPASERRLRALLRETRNAGHSDESDESKEETLTPVIQKELLVLEKSTRDALNALLRELREILHRRGRLSSRNEALAELSKLLFAHVMSVIHDGRGLSRATVLHNQDGSLAIASQLKTFVRTAFERHMPTALAHELETSDYDLHIKAQENALASEIITCFELHAPTQGLDHIESLPNLDALNDVFGSFLADSFVDEKELGQYLTPSEVVRFVVQLALRDMTSSELTTLLSPEFCSDFGLILDPSCGTGSFITEILRELYRRVVGTHSQRKAWLWLQSMINDVVVGIDKSERMTQFALTNMGMFGLPATKLHLANALARTGDDAELMTSLEGKVGLILTNPPFGAEFAGRELAKYKIATTWAQHQPRTVDSELLFIERYLDWLAPGGRCLTIVPDSILTNQGLFKELRARISHQIALLGVISLPPVTFGAAGTSTKTSVVYFRKLPLQDGSQHSTFFAVCRNIGYSVATRGSHRRKVTTDENDLPIILQEYSSHERPLALGRRVTGVESTERWDASFHASLAKDVEHRIRYPYKSDSRIGDLATLSSERADPRRFGAETFDYIEISDVDSRTCTLYTKPVRCSEAPSRARKVVHTGDVLISTVRPERRTVGIVREDQDGAICTTGFAVLRPHSIDSLILAHLFKTDFVNSQIMRRNIGIAYPAIDEQSLLDILVPLDREALGALSTKAHDILRLEKQLRDMRAELRIHLLDIMASSLDTYSTTADSTPHQLNRTTSHSQQHTQDSELHDQDIWELAEGRKI